MVGRVLWRACFTHAAATAVAGPGASDKGGKRPLSARPKRSRAISGGWPVPTPRQGLENYRKLQRLGSRRQHQAPLTQARGIAIQRKLLSRALSNSNDRLRSEMIGLDRARREVHLAASYDAEGHEVT